MATSKEKLAWKDANGICNNCSNPRIPGIKICKRCQETQKKRHRSRFIEDPAYREKLKTQARKWQIENPEKTKRIQSKCNKKTHLITKLEAIKRYGGCCACCGETAYQFLSLDHSLGDGKAHRLKILGNTRSAGSVFYFKLKALGWPDVPGLRVLCFNCHFAIDLWGGCPHQAIINGTVGDPRVEAMR